MSQKNKTLTSRCPFCDGDLEITHLQCKACDTGIDSSLTIPSFFRLPNHLQLFVLVFLRCRGNIREVEKELGISYPTVCKRLDLVNELLEGRSPAESAEQSSGDIAISPQKQKVTISRERVLEQVEQGALSAREAAQLLRELKSQNSS